MKARALISSLALVLTGVSAGALAVAQAPPAAASCGGFGVTSISPNGFLAGGASVDIQGCGFSGSGTLTVTFGTGTPITVTPNSDTDLTVMSPSASSPGAVTITVTLTPTSGTPSSATTSFDYLSPPSLSSIAPTSGPEKGGTAVDVTGTGFNPAQSSTEVDFGTKASTTVTGLTDTALTATSPAGTGTQNVTVKVTLADGDTATSNSEQFTYVPAPTVTAVSPTSGPPTGGTDVTVTGTNFQPGAEVLFGPGDGSTASNLQSDTAATPVSESSSTSILVTAPAGIPGATNVVVLNPDGQYGVLTSSDAGHFSYSGSAPTVSSISPSSGSSLGGTPITITGTGFIAGASVAFNSGSETNPPTATSVSVSADGTHITATTPAHSAGTVDVVVTNVGGGTVTDTGGFTFNAAPAPTVTGVLASNGTSLGGTLVTISGTNLVPGSTVKFGDTPAPIAAVQNSTTIKATTPGHASGAVTVSVTLPDGQVASLASGYTFNAAAAPTITSVNPGSGDGGTEITISGTGFASTNGSSTNAASAAVVQVGSTPCDPTSTSTNSTCLQPVPPVPPAVTSPPVVLSDTSIQGLVPDAPGGTVTVTVTNPDGQSASSSFTYTGPTGAPTLTNVSPATASSLGGTQVTLTGTNFVTGAVVRFGNCASGQTPPCGSPAPSGSVTVSSSTSITAETPAGVYGTVAVTVINPGGAFATLKHAFGFTAAAQPTITGVSPSSGPGGTTVVTVTGTGFANINGASTNAASAGSVTIGGQVLLPQLTGSPPTVQPVVRSDTQIVGIVPNLPAGTYDVAILNPDGQGAIDQGGYTVPSDTTAPTVQATATYGPAASAYTFGNWANGTVKVTLTATDNAGGSGVKSITYSATGAQAIPAITVAQANVGFSISAQGTTTITYSAIDNAGNASTPQTAVVMVDTVAPTLTASATVPSGTGTAPYTSGTQTNQNVTITFSCSDAGSGVNTLTFSAGGSTTTSSGTNPKTVTVTSEGQNQSVTATCTDVAGNTTTTVFGGIDIAKTAPLISVSATAAGTPYTAGVWTNKPVTVIFTCTPLSPSDQVVSLTGPVQVAGPAENQTVSGTCVDAAGNSSTITFGTATAGIDIDLTLPIATATATLQGTNTPYVAGTWTNRNVVVTFTCSDDGPDQSGVASVAPAVTVTAEGTTSGVIGGCVDTAGNTANPPAFFGPILIDKTAPSSSVAVNPNPLSPGNGKLVNVTATLLDSDALSGINGFTLVSVTSNNPATASTDIVGFTPGTASTTGQLRATKGRLYTFTYRVSDVAGNTSQCTTQVTVRS
jgi:hypothetical protein